MLVHEFVMADREEIIKNISENEMESNLPIISYSLKKGKECVNIEDEVILENYQEFSHGFKTSWYCAKGDDNGLCYDGITVILWENLREFLEILLKYKYISSINKLIDLCTRAIAHNKDIVHFGI